jgi:hypothetical protein
MKKHLPLILLIVCAGVFFTGVLELFKLRFETGDIYPPYSSLRADPLGTMAFYESLEKVPGLTVRRDYSSANQLPEGPNTTYLHLASSTYEWHWLPDDLVKELRQYLARGGRLVITMEPQSTSTHRAFLDEQDEDFDPDKQKSDGKKSEVKKAGDKSKSSTNSVPAKAATNSVEEKFLLKTAPDEAATNSTLAKAGTNFTLAKAVTNSASGKTGTNSAPDKMEKKTGSRKPTRKRPLRIGDEREVNLTSIQELWGVDFAIVNLPPGSNDTYQAVRVTNQTDLPLPYTLDWHSGIVCSNLNAAWHKIYLRGTNPVVVERRFGHGSVVIATDSFFLSNEAMQRDRHADVLAWLVSSGSNVVFDEAHLGVMESSGVAMLMRKYRLHWLAGALVLLAGLFVWKNSVSLIPPHADEGSEEFIAGKDAAAGFVNLLRRSIPGRDLLATCFAEWSKASAPTGKYSTARLQQADAVFQAEKSACSRDRNPVQAYRNICNVLKARHVEPAPSKPTPDTSHLTPDTSPSQPK